MARIEDSAVLNWMPSPPGWLVVTSPLGRAMIQSQSGRAADGKDFYGSIRRGSPRQRRSRAGSRWRRISSHPIVSARRTSFPTAWFQSLGDETSRHEGVVEAQILALMGVRPKWDARGRVQGVELIPRTELDRRAWMSP